MDFYVSRVLFPSLLIDVLLTISLLSFFKENISLQRIRKLLGAFVPASLYFITALVWTVIYSGDPRFQGQGVLGLFLFMALGMVFTFLRLLLGLIFFIILRRTK